MKERPNILLVVMDTARADSFTPYGSSNPTPAVAQLAARGGAHPATFSTACWTVPAHGSLFSGLLPRSGGLAHEGGQELDGYRAAMRSLQDRLLSTRLSNAGWSTAGVSTNAWISEHSGFDTGFDEFHYLAPHRPAANEQGGRRNDIKWALAALRARTDDGANAVERMIAAWAADRRRSPFFWFVNLIECHSPYLPPKRWNPLGVVDRLRAAREARRHLTFLEIWKCSVGGFDVPADAIERMRRLYDGAIRQMDDWLARVLECLDAHGLLDETQIVVTSDHGENIGHGDLLGHCFSLDDRLIRVPFVTAGVAPPPTDEVFSLDRVPAWLARVAGLEDHPWHEPALPDGVAVAQFDSPGAGNEVQSREAVERWGLGQDAFRRLTTSFVAATDGRFKLLRFAGAEGPSEQLFDLRRDPLETAPISPDRVSDPAAGIPRLRSALETAAAAERPRFDVPSVDAPTPVDQAERDEIEEQMRLLGYL